LAVALNRVGADKDEWKYLPLVQQVWCTELRAGAVLLWVNRVRDGNCKFCHTPVGVGKFSKFHTCHFVSYSATRLALTRGSKRESQHDKKEQETFSALMKDIRMV
jgi:hypothetical protein